VHCLLQDMAVRPLPLPPAATGCCLACGMSPVRSKQTCSAAGLIVSPGPVTVRVLPLHLMPWPVPPPPTHPKQSHTPSHLSTKQTTLLLLLL
jgi:hypothetical protein